MGRYFGNNGQEIGFPDEFGEDIYQTGPEQHQAAAPSANRSTPPFCGYVTPSWFGPFLLAPRNRGERGWC